MKLLYFFKDTFNQLTRNAKYLGENDNFSVASEKDRFTKIFADSAWLENSSFEIRYVNKQGLEFLIKGTNKTDFVISFPKELFDLIEELTIVRRNFGDLKLLNYKDINEYIVKNSDFTRLVKNVISDSFGEVTPQVFIPAGRSFFSAIHENIYSIISDHNNTVSLDPFLLDFGSLYQRVKDLSSHLVEEGNESYLSIIEEVLGGKFIEENDKEYIVHKDSRKVELKNTSSGQQEALPLMLLLKSILTKQLYSQGCVLYIEEPEAHLFPTAQKSIVDLLSKVYNSNPENIQIFITTHSPYILTSFNNLIYAGNVAKVSYDKKIKVLGLVPEDQLLSHSIVNANAITVGDTINLMDDENHIIDASLLDKVSNTIGEQFDELLDIEFESNEL